MSSRSDGEEEKVVRATVGWAGSLPLLLAGPGRAWTECQEGGYTRKAFRRQASKEESGSALPMWMGSEG